MHGKGPRKKDIATLHWGTPSIRSATVPTSIPGSISARVSTSTVAIGNPMPCKIRRNVSAQRRSLSGRWEAIGGGIQFHGVESFGIEFEPTALRYARGIKSPAPVAVYPAARSDANHRDDIPARPSTLRAFDSLRSLRGAPLGVTQRVCVRDDPASCRA